jgi:SAM-dependent methyltransferase
LTVGNTPQSFFDKWSKNANAFYAETLREGSDTQQWILQRNGYLSPQAWATRLASCARVLDAGCGNGRVTALLRQLAPVQTEVVGIDLVAADVARQNFEGAPNMRFETRDLVRDVSGIGHFDYIYCQEVLHHTADPEKAFHNLCGILRPGGEIAIYVYRQKAPAREYVDDYVRSQISDLPYEQAMEQCRQITAFGRALTEAGIKVTVPKVEILGVEGGEYDVQRLIYHFFAKCYWNPDLSEHENVLVNYDWYHPQVATRHTLPEVERWFEKAGLTIEHRCIDHYGITVQGRKGSSSPM